MNFLKRFFEGDSDDILFFIIVFLFLFNGSFFGKNRGCADELDSSSILFFIILFLLLFFNTEAAES